jgi:hypothetical protein
MPFYLIFKLPYSMAAIEPDAIDALEPAIQHEDPLEYIRMNAEYDLDTFFKSYIGKVEFIITRTNRYHGECRFKPDVPDDVQLQITQMLQNNLWYFNKDLEDQEIFDREQKRADTYDVIILLDVHGSGRLVSVDGNIECKINSLDGNYVTFLQASPCGITNYSPTGWHKIANTIVKQSLTFFGSTKTGVSFIQNIFRKEKVKFIKKSPQIKHDLTTEDAPDALAFMREPGWDIITSNVNYGDRSYTIDPEMISIVIVYTEHERTLPLNANLQNVIKQSNIRTEGKKGQFNRQLLLDYLFEQGAKHPLIIDNSCGDIYGTKRDVRAIIRAKKGGTRKKNKQIRSRSKRSTRRSINKNR